MNEERRRDQRTPRPPHRAPTLTPAESRMLIRVGFRIPGVLLAIAATVVLVTLVSVNSELTGTFGAIAGMWFAVHQVPLTIAGTALAVFPLMPTIILAVVVMRGVSRTVSSTSTRRECALVFGAAVLGPLVVTAIALAVAADASAAIGMSSPKALMAFAWVAGVHAAAAAVGIAAGTWNSDAVAERIPDWTRLVVAPTVRAGSVLVAGAGAIVVAAMVASWATMESLLATGDGFVGVLGLTVLSILYLPNVMVGALAVSVGSSAHVGDVVVSMFRTAGGPVPPLPVLAVLPEGAAHTVWLLMLIVPVTAGVFLGRDCGRRAVDVHHALSSVWVGASVLGVAALLLGFAAGGNLGTFGTVEVTVWSFGLLVFAWVAVVGSVAAATTVWRGGNEQSRDGEPDGDAADAEPVAIATIAQPAELAEAAGDSIIVADPEVVTDAEVVADPEVVADAEVVADPEVVADAEVVADSSSSDDVMDAEIVTPAPEGDEPPATAEDLPDKPPSASD